ncbi:MAG: tRNA (adenosine(37)-N6)-threonylcarbamoyltransferase complex dimerization subunit type 1 TsaB [Oscillospiraceae bacterium]|nr:tRNA (adenosine(37)-N6)-threonylcarbamoyltransferase complex dimerization subunit type 1 TsaB [Oscillospiraceae bacterium]
MNILGLDSSAKAASAAVLDADNKIITAYGGVNVKITHSETLMPLTESVLAAAKLSLSDIDAFAVTAGPGSFTGVRIAVSAVKGMAYALNKPVYAVSTLHSLAYNLLGQDCIACCLMDARRGQFYNALFRIAGGEIERLTPDRAIDADELEAELHGYAGDDAPKIITVGDGAELFNNASIVLSAPIAQLHQNAVSVCLAASEYTPVPAKELMPLYLRPPQAERERRDGRPCPPAAKGENL